MRRIRITAVRRTEYPELMAKYENPLENPCGIRLGDEFVVSDCRKPEGMCDSAWQTLLPFVTALAHGAENLFDGWMRNPRTLMLSCNDGFRPVSFLLEVIEE